MTNLITKTAFDDPHDGHPPYRLAVLLIMLNQDGQIFVGRNTKPQADGKQWQLPQGGINAVYRGDQEIERETAAAAAMRELAEEVGRAVQATILRVEQTPVRFEFNDDFNPKYRGQSWLPVLLRYDGGAVDLSYHEPHKPPAFDDYAWRPAAQVLAAVTTTKQAAYQIILSQFGLLPNNPLSVQDRHNRNSTQTP